jgi:8-oxo-dGTP diphosphatase
MRPAQAGCGRKRRGGGRQQTLRAGGVQAGWAVMNERHNATDERFHPCPGGRHWGPRGAAGILPYTVAGDGRAWVLLSHRSPHVQRGGTWSTFGGAIDVGETAWRAAVRETCEEIRGITPDQADIAGGYGWECPQGCGWTYTTFVVRVPLHSGGSLPRVRVARGRAAWETAGLAWVPAGQVQAADRDLHPSFADAWPTLRETISA